MHTIQFGRVATVLLVVAVVFVEATTAKSGVILQSTPSDIAMGVASGGGTA